MPAKLMTIEEVAEYLRVKRSTVCEWAKESKVAAAKVGRLWRFDRTEVEEWVKRQKPGTERQRVKKEDLC